MLLGLGGTVVIQREESLVQQMTSRCTSTSARVRRNIYNKYSLVLNIRANMELFSRLELDII